jgi:hypothetical protein
MREICDERKGGSPPAGGGNRARGAHETLVENVGRQNVSEGTSCRRSLYSHKIKLKGLRPEEARNENCRTSSARG